MRNVHWLEPGASGIKATKDQNLMYYTRTKNNKELQKKRRLVTTGLNGMIIEWDLLTQQPRFKYNCNCAIWDSKMIGKFMVVACHDGSVRLLKVRKTKIELIKMLAKDATGCLSVEIVPRKNQPAKEKKQKKKQVKAGSSSEESSEEEEDYNFQVPFEQVFAGYEDGTIKLWDLKSGNCLQHFDKSAGKGADHAKIWQLKYIEAEGENFLVSGDSKGEVSIWQTKFGTLAQTFKNLKGDIFALEFSGHNQALYATGVDSRVLSIQTQRDPRSNQIAWKVTSMFRGQSHDINSLVLLSANQLLSGGITTDICVYKLQDGRFADQFGKNSVQQKHQQKLRHVPPFPFREVASLCSGCNSTKCDVMVV